MLVRSPGEVKALKLLPGVELLSDLLRLFLLYAKVGEHPREGHPRRVPVFALRCLLLHSGVCGFQLCGKHQLPLLPADTVLLQRALCGRAPFLT